MILIDLPCFTVDQGAALARIVATVSVVLLREPDQTESFI
jgi:hypothetical protein